MTSKLPINDVHRIVLTGGPCGGKTTCIARLSSYLRERGFIVMTCPEAYSILVTNGMSPDQYFTSGIPGIENTIQNVVMNMQIALEDELMKLLREIKKPGVLLCDRGVMDGKAYMSTQQWNDLVHSRGVKSECELRDMRYDAIFHLVSAAKGAEKYYSLANNNVRTETIEEASMLDEKTLEAWVGHPRLCIFDNSTDFEDKLQKVVNITANLVGLPSQLRREPVKFLLRKTPSLEKFPNDVNYQVFDVEKVYLYEERDKASLDRLKQLNYSGEYSFIRKRSQCNGQGTVYGQTIVQYGNDGHENFMKRIISNREYSTLFKGRDMQRHIISQKRISFLYNMQSFNVHIYKQPADGLCILHCQVMANAEDEELKVDLPPFLDVERILKSKEDIKEYGAQKISIREHD